ncbi:MAG: LemA family protein [Chthoniobacterales bacterium]
MEILLLILVVIIVFPLIYLILQYNGFVSLRNQIAEAWSNIDTELKRRYELIPNLVNTVKGYATHEREVLEHVVQLRNSCMANTGSPAEQIEGENQLTGALKQLLAVAENYPNLKADASYLQLQNELVNTEDRIQAARRFYNGNVRDYRVKFESFPTNLIASTFHFAPEEFLTIDSVVREVPEVKF